MERMPMKKGPTIDQQIDTLLHKVPLETKRRWERETEDLSAEEQLQELQQRYELRQAKLRTNFERSKSPSGVEVVGEVPLAVQRTIEALDAGPHERLGQGLSARVIASARSPGLCYKVFFPIEHQPSGTNDIAIELELQKEIFALGPVAGVRVPATNFFVTNQTIRAIAMEQLDGVSLKDVMEGKEPMPAAFEPKAFFGALRSFISALHEKGYYHRDLHGGNVLVDRTTGSPYVIDFGHAVHTISDEGVYMEEVVESGRKKTIVLLSDEEAPKLLEKKITAFLANKQETS